MSSFFLKQNDTLPAIQYTFLDEDGDAINLTGATVKIYMQNATDGTTKIDGGSCTVTDAANGVVTYSWADADVDESGLFWAEFVADFSGEERSSPDPGWLAVVISSSIRGS